MTSNAQETTVIEMLRAGHKGGPKLTAADLTGAITDEAAAYRIQRAVTGSLGAVGGFKTGRASPDAPSIMAPILAERIRYSPAQYSRDEMDLVGIELEVAFHVDRELPDPADPGFADEARQCISPAAVIEMVDTRLADHENADPLWKLADNQINAGLVFSDPIAQWADLDLTHVAAKLQVADQIVFDGTSAVPGGNAFGVFCAFARLVGEHCGGLRPGQWVTTGSVTAGLRFIGHGEPVIGTIKGLGEVRVAVLDV
jgi:2-keto-4-pentenoate hydratase